jgi:hypothetical protein
MSKLERIDPHDGRVLMFHPTHKHPATSALVEAYLHQRRYERFSTPHNPWMISRSWVKAFSAHLRLPMVNPVVSTHTEVITPNSKRKGWRT